MIKWQANFNIPDSTVQAAEVFIKVVSYKNMTTSSIVNFIMTDGQSIIINDHEEDNIIKSYEKTFDRTIFCGRVDEKTKFSFCVHSIE